MLRKWCISLAGLAVVAGSLAFAGPASAAMAPGDSHPSLMARSAHPVQPGGVMTAPAAHGTRPLALQRIRNAVESTNWSGYAATGRKFSSVSAGWTEPTVTCPGGNQFSAFWVGLDGFNSSTVEQTGSSADCNGTRPHYYAWYEMFPANPVNFANTVKAGDHFTASVTHGSGSSYTLKISDTTRGWSHTVKASLSGAANNSAEAIVEAPCCTASGGPLPLAHFSTRSFRNVKANGSTIGSFSPTKIIMVNNSGQAKDSISALTSGTGFSATWLRRN